MRRLLPSLSRLLHLPDALFLVLWLASVLAGILVYQDFGLTWDEPLFYQYSDAVGAAYSVPDWLAGTVDLEEVYGPSAEDHKYYGAGYLLIARNATRLIQALTRLDAWTVWHLTNFLFFELGMLFFYLLCKRWMRPPAAAIASALYLTQPVVWGHAFINPKDMPFATLFILAIYFGLRMVDRLSVMGVRSSRETGKTASHLRAQATRARCALGLRPAATLAIGCALIALLLAAFGEGWRGALGDIVRQAYSAPPDSLLGRAFVVLARSRDVLSLDYYLGRVYSAYRWMNVAVGLAALAFGLIAWVKAFPTQAARLGSRLRDAWSPPPTWPSLARPETRFLVSPLAVLLPGIFLGLLIAVRVLGPLAGLLILLAYVLQPQRRSWLPLLPYAATAGVLTLACWPYLWPAPIERFLEVVRHMADNPKLVPVLYEGVVRASSRLPGDYLPRMLALTLTEPVWLLAGAGLVVSVGRFFCRRLDWRSWIAILLWFLVPFGYVVTQQPAMYDGYRHFLFLLPPVFIACGLAIDELWSWLRVPVAQGVTAGLLVLPGLLGIIRLHPYPYAYYNGYAGGVGGAFRVYETDYWLTCYKETVQDLRDQGLQGKPLYVHRQPAIAQAYAGPQWPIEPFDPDADLAPPGSLLLLTTRSNSDRWIHPDDPIVLTIGRQGAIFCVVKSVP